MVGGYRGHRCAVVEVGRGDKIWRKANICPILIYHYLVCFKTYSLQAIREHSVRNLCFYWLISHTCQRANDANDRFGVTNFIFGTPYKHTQTEKDIHTYAD